MRAGLRVPDESNDLYGKIVDGLMKQPLVVV
jgi:hypothetical protein